MFEGALLNALVSNGHFGRDNHLDYFKGLSNINEHGNVEMTLSVDSKVGDLLDNPQAKVILDKHMPGFSSNPQVAMARGFSLKMAAGFSGGQITAAMLSAVDADLAAL